ncbi:MAG: AAA family ATPase, partial [Patescibacteria group bacterium]
INIGVVTGSISGVIVIDVEAGGSTDGLVPTVISKTGGGGWHYYYKHPGHPVPTKTRIKEKVDIRGDGGYAVLPPSIHQSGKEYEWAMPPEMADIVDIPKDFELTNIPIHNPLQNKMIRDWNKIMSSTNPEGVRNSTAAVVAGKIASDIPRVLLEIAGWPAFKSWNKNQNSPPLEEKELRGVWDSICSAHASNKIQETNRTKDNKTISPIHLSELFKKEFPEPEWTVEHLVPAGAITAVSGAPASYKTWVMIELAKTVARGENLFNTFKTTKGNVLIIDEENGERMFYDRFKKIEGSDDLNIFLLSLDSFKLTSQTVQQLKDFCKKESIKLIIFDSLVRIHSGNENDAMDMSEVMGMLRQIAKEGITIIFTHHHRKSGILRSNPSQDMRGSSDILASVDCHLAMERKNKVLTIRQTKLRHMEERKPFQLNIVGDENKFEFEFSGDLDETEMAIDNVKVAIKEILEREGVPTYKKKLFEMVREAGVKAGQSTFKKAVDELEEAGEIFTQQGPKNTVYCFTSPFDKSDINSPQNILLNG